MTTNTKVTEAIAYLGKSPIIVDSVDKRSAVRRLLNGLGLRSEQYMSVGYAGLQDVYNDLLGGFTTQLAMHCSDVSNNQRDAAASIMSGIILGSTPIPAQPTQAIQPVPPAAIPAKPEIMSTEQALMALKTLLGSPQAAPLDESRIISLIKEHGATPQPTRVEITQAGQTRVVEGLHHKDLTRVIKAMSAGCNIMLVGAAGSGKTTIIEQAAEALGLPFYFNGAISSEYKLTGFVDAQGRIVSTAFRKAYESGGVYLFDEIDASMPDALLAFNSALANGQMDFPDGTIKRHKDFYCAAAANTYCKGADRVYVGRNQLDAASLDRFTVINLDYDESLERALAGNDNWTDKVQAARKACAEHKIRHVISPRASIMGAKMLAAGFKESDVLDMVLFKGLDVDSVKKIKGGM